MPRTRHVARSERGSHPNADIGVAGQSSRAPPLEPSAMQERSRSPRLRLDPIGESPPLLRRLDVQNDAIR